MAKAWDTAVVRADATVTTNETGPDGKPGKDVTVPHPHAGRAGVVQAVDGDNLTVRLDETADGKPAEVVTVDAAAVDIKHVL
ncbi:hypothetical protein PWR66_07660 [Paraburkholderia sp. A1RO-5]|uniref:hypothetical protein n=1 Tax=Paraburkholderia sp. A1RO-5 TaxID=3028369 RepID=UPI003B76BF2B